MVSIYISNILLCSLIRLHRATWIATELSITFPAPQIQTISLVAAPAPLPAGRFRMWLTEAPNNVQSDPVVTLIWDRKVEDGFPDLKLVVRRPLFRISND